MHVMMQPMRPRGTHKLDSTQNDYAVASNLLGDFPAAWGGDIIIHVTNSATIGTASAGSPTTNAALEAINCGPMAASSVLIDSGCIVSGRGGGGGAAAPTSSCAAGSGGGGGASGLRTDHPMEIENNGAIYGGGGGGGGAGGSSGQDSKSCGCLGGGGNNGGNGQGSQGAAGTRGGAYGTAGTNGPVGSNGGCGAGSGGNGGAAGNYAIGFSYMTFKVAGTTAGGTTG